MRAVNLGLWLCAAGAVWLAVAVMAWDPSPQAPSGPAWHSSTAAGGNRPATQPQAVISARDVFVERCAACHGDDGQGDGPAALSLNPRPRRFTDSEWQQTVTDDQIETIIKYGGGAVGRSALMPSSPDLQRDVQLVAGLRTIVRGFKR
jgi:mono/diheme cytochrome c family protein